MSLYASYEDMSEGYIPGTAVRLRNRKGRNRRAGVYMVRFLRGAK